MRRSTRRRLIELGVLTSVFIILTALSTNSAVCEFFAASVSRAWIFLFGNIFGVLPFSVYEFFLIAAIAGVIAFLVCLIVFLCKRKWRRLVTMTLVSALTVVSFLNVYTLSASFGYNREPLPQEVYKEYRSEDFSYEEAVELTRILIDKANNAYLSTEHDKNGNIVYPYDFKKISALIAEEYKKLDNGYFSPYTPKAKKIINKTIMSEMHIVGVFFAPFGEANINGNENNMYLPVTMAHELAHGKGVMRENEANLIAYYVLLTSKDPYLSYGATVKCMSAALSLVSLYPDSEKTYFELVSSVNSGIAVERKNYNAFYDQFTLLDDIGEFFNDIYLKLQGQGGTNSYVKPPEIVDTGEVDKDDNPIYRIINFSDTQNLLIKLYKENNECLNRNNL